MRVLGEISDAKRRGTARLLACCSCGVISAFQAASCVGAAHLALGLRGSAPQRAPDSMQPPGEG